MTPDKMTCNRTTKAPCKANETSAADPMAKPLPMAAVVLPAASRASVFRALQKLHISAIPPAWSDIGPKPSVVRPHANVESMPKASRAIPYRSQSLKETNMADAIVNAGMIQLL